MLYNTTKSFLISQAYSDFIQCFPWDFWFTITFRKPKKDAIYISPKIWDVLGGSEWGPGRADRLFLVGEPHTTGFLHFHGLLHESRHQYTGEGFRNAREYQAIMEKYWGRSDCDSINNLHDVSHYCSKYVTKEINSKSIDHFLFGKWK